MEILLIESTVRPISKETGCCGESVLLIVLPSPRSMMIVGSHELPNVVLMTSIVADGSGSVKNSKYVTFEPQGCRAENIENVLLNTVHVLCRRVWESVSEPESEPDE